MPALLLLLLLLLLAVGGWVLLAVWFQKHGWRIPRRPRDGLQRVRRGCRRLLAACLLACLPACLRTCCACARVSV